MPPYQQNRQILADPVTPINSTAKPTVVLRGRENRSSRPSKPSPLGVSAGAAGLAPAEVNVAVFAPGADALDIHFEDADGRWASALLPELTDGVHHGIVRGLLPGSRYALWPHGEALPDGGAGQLLLDPYGRAIDDDGGIFRSVHLDAGFDWAAQASRRRCSTHVPVSSGWIRDWPKVRSGKPSGPITPAW